MILIINVAIPIPLFQTFDYFFNLNGDTPVIGARVLVPFKKRNIIGIVISINKNNNKYFLNTLKPISKVIDRQPIFTISLWRTLTWAMKYYHSPIGEVLFHALPSLLHHDNPTTMIPLKEWFLTKKGLLAIYNKVKITPRQKQTLITLLDSPIYQHQIKNVKLSNITLQKLKIKGLCDLRSLTKELPNWYINFNIKDKLIQLNDEQNMAINSIFCKNNKFIVWLIHKLDGYEKIKVYLKILENILKNKKQALILVPKINFITKLIIYLQEKLNAPISILHPKLNECEQLNIWLQAKHEKNAIVIGTNIALFTPFAKLGIIIIDEEHDQSYKQQYGLWCYHTRDLAIFRAREEEIPILLSSTTPSLETLYNIKIKKYHHLNVYQTANNTPRIYQHLLDIRKLSLYSGLSSPLLKIMRTHLIKNGNQVILFLNQYGFRQILLCKICGWIATCKYCKQYLTLHYYQHKLQCNYCHYHHSLFYQCLYCKSTQLIKTRSSAEQIEITLSSFFPNIPVTCINHDTYKYKQNLKKYFIQIQNNKQAHIIISTPMLLTKGYNFPDVTLISLLNIDSVLFSNNFRAIEYFAQFYIQLSKYINNNTKYNEIVLQTYYPEHIIFKTLLYQGYAALSQYLLKERYQTQLPPFYSHILLCASDCNATQAKLFLNQLYKFILTCSKVYKNTLKIIGPFPITILTSNKCYSWKLLLSHSSRIKLQYIVSNTLPLIIKLAKIFKVRWSINVDPN